MSTRNITERHARHRIAMRSWLDGRSYYNALQAMELVATVEEGFRKDGITPKFHHQLSVTRLLATLTPHMLFPEETITTGFLHDMLEDHGATFTRDMIERDYGKRVADAVWHLSKKMPGLVKDKEVYFTEMTQDPIASLVKLADRAHNLQTMQGVFNLDKQRAYAQEVEDWFLPMAKKSRRNFPRQYAAYENLCILLRCQSEFVSALTT